VLMLAGKYQFRPEPPFIPGSEASGHVVAVGPDVTGFVAGDAVMSRHNLGACAELGNAKAALCDRMPAGMTLAQAGVFRGAYTTAYHALLQRGRMRAGEWVLVQGAAGGIGIAAIQVAKAFGARVIATAGSEVKRTACLEEGAEHAIDYRSGFVDAVKQLTGGRGVDIVYDPIGDKVAEESLRCLAWGGRLLILGFLGGGPTNIRSNYLLIKGIEAVGVRIGGLNEADPDLAAANMRALLTLADAGKLRPRISHTLRLDQAREALQAVIDRAVIGKAVLLG
jgi:NADPH:quinone reductase